MTLKEFTVETAPLEWFGELGYADRPQAEFFAGRTGGGAGFVF